ncbi:hypothetical protein [Rickettsiella massiliensis]|uniref:hypothetical protein n=1 Tax=Rickettsiella massiliensis TaxID=676517 RepID=UPI00029AE366|nr:hypothetical protein [Rickettsiella massiliensis]
MIKIKAVQNKFNEHREKALFALSLQEDKFFSIYDPNKVKSEKVKEREKNLLRAVGSLQAVYNALASFCANKKLNLTQIFNFEEMPKSELKWLPERESLELECAQNEPLTNFVKKDLDNVWDKASLAH